MRNARRGWIMLEEDARSMLTMVEERIKSSDIRVEHRDALIRLRDMIEDDLMAAEMDRRFLVGSAGTDGGQSSDYPPARSSWRTSAHRDHRQ